MALVRKLEIFSPGSALGHNHTPAEPCSCCLVLFYGDQIFFIIIIIVRAVMIMAGLQTNEQFIKETYDKHQCQH